MRTLAALLMIFLLTVLAHSDGLYNTSGAYVVGQIPGTATNDNATAGNVGEYVESQIAMGTTQALTTNTPLNVTSISLTPGDWMVGGTVTFIGGATTTFTQLLAGLSDVSATIQQVPLSKFSPQAYASATIFASGSSSSLFVGPTRWSIATTTIVYLIGRASFATSTASTNGGHLWARRMR